MADLRKMTEEERLALLKKYTIAGFAALPWLHFVTIVWFFGEARRPDASPLYRKYLILCAIGCTLWTAFLITWTTIYQLEWQTWGHKGDRIAILIPKGNAQTS